MGALTFAIYLTAASDAATTHYNLRHGLAERNPIMRSLIGDQPSRVWVIKGLAAPAIVYLISKAPKDRQKDLKITTIVIWGLASLTNFLKVTFK